MKHDATSQNVVADLLASHFRGGYDAAVTVEPEEPKPEQFTTITIVGAHGVAVVEVRAMFEFVPCSEDCEMEDPLP